MIGRSIYANVIKYRGLLQQNLKFINNQYLCKLKWAKETIDNKKGPAVTSLVAIITGHRYYIITKLFSLKYDSANFSILAVNSMAIVANNWKKAVNALGSITINLNIININFINQ